MTLLARVDAGQTLRREPLALKLLLEDVCRQARLIGPRRLILCEPLPDVQILGDRDALKQVLLILVDNAQVHTSPDTVIRLSAKLAGGGVALSASDTGPGIAPDVLPHIFERFYRGEVSRSGRSSGLGLAIAKELVERQEGRSRLKARWGRGVCLR